MGRFEFYIEGANQEVAVEVKRREVEVLDLIQRVIEGYSFSDLNGTSGKQRLKEHIRQELNTLVTRGRIKKVFFKTITVQP